ncbi:MAG TPA: outer membrane protein assembly factor BamD [Desulfurivibrionaceae bacterium]|nr:outer membrane protein assembly factor BamD [Desulfurivibrionaceae bacterium]
MLVTHTHGPRTKRVGRQLAAVVLAGLLATGLAGCSVLDTTLDFFGFGGSSSAPDTAEGLAMQAMDAFNHGKYADALKHFEEIKDRYPFSAVGLLAELKAADAKFYMKHYDEALVLYEEFENNHPTNEAMPYVLFQMGMCHYEKIDTIDRDPGAAMSAVAGFSRLLKAFPQSPYGPEAQARLLAARDFLANHEMYVAAFYVKTEELPQAEGRLKYLLANYPDSTIVPKAKELLAAIQAGKAPSRTWRDWIPDISLPSWKSFLASFGTPGGGAAPGGGSVPDGK